MKEEMNKAKRKNSKGKGKYGSGKARANNSDDYKARIKERDRNASTLSNEERDNDPNWYFLDRKTAELSASFSFDQFIGVPTKFGGDLVTGGDHTISKCDYYSSVPSIMVLEMNPCPGDTSQITTGINMAALKTYTELSSLNAKTTNYAPQDITTLTLAMGEIISILEHIRRAFGVAFTYNQRNRSMPKRLLEAMGFDADDFLKDLAQHRLSFNSWITALNKIPFLDNVAYLYKCADMYQKVYLDSDSSMAQVVLSKPFSTWTINEAYSDQGTGLTTTSIPKAFATSGNKWTDWTAVVDSMLEKLTTSTTYNYIYSDILNLSAKKGAKLLFLDYLVEGYTVVPEYNRNYMLQVHNATVVGNPNAAQATQTTTKFNDVSPNVNKNIVDYNPIFKNRSTIEGAVYPESIVVDFDTSNITLEDRIEATRFQAMLKPVESSADAIFLSCCDHYVVDIAIAYNVIEDGQTKPTNSVVKINSNYIINGNLNDTKAMSLTTQFDWAPIFYFGEILAGSKTAQLFYMGDLNHFTTLDSKWFEKVNDLTFQALFAYR